MNKKIITSERGSISWRDTFNGLAISAGTGALFYVQGALDKGDWSFNWKGVLMAAVSGAVAYLVKKVTDPPKVVTILKKNAQVENAADNIKSAL